MKRASCIFLHLKFQLWKIIAEKWKTLEKLFFSLNDVLNTVNKYPHDFSQNMHPNFMKPTKSTHSRQGFF